MNKKIKDITRSVELKQWIIPFEDDPTGGEIEISKLKNGKVYVSIKPCIESINIDWSGQRKDSLEIMNNLNQFT